MTKQEAYNNLLDLIKKHDAASKINGKSMNVEKAQGFAEMIKLADYLFPNMEIEINSLFDNTTPVHSITIYDESFGINQLNKEKYFNLIQLADNVTIYSEEEDKCSISFNIEGIWEE